MKTKQGARIEALAKLFISRASSQGLKGKARDRAAIEFFVGAAAYASIAFGASSKEWSTTSAVAFLVSLRGYVEVEALAKPQEKT